MPPKGRAPQRAQPQPGQQHRPPARGLRPALVLVQVADVASQLLLALSMLALYEIGIIAARLLVPGARQVDEQRDKDLSSRA